jgi:two-component system response regulator AtoC
MNDMRALVVEVDALTRPGLFGFLRRRGYQCVAVSSETEALDALADGSFSFTLIDLDGNGTDPAEQIRYLKVRGRNSGPIIAVADRRVHNLDAAELAVEVVLPKPLNLDELQQVLDTVIRPVASDLSSGPEHTAGRLAREMDLWRSPKMLDARQILHEAARVDVTVLITGETGTGKDLIARAIHHFSSRRAGPFIKVNCAAMPRELLESELFGYERGAFTGAHKLKIGKFEAAHRGTIFLDEIGDLHPALQAKLLHVLQDGEFSRIGAKTTLSVDVRVLAATNQDLERAVEEGRFREDLYYRLNVINMCAPPLRERAAEIPLLANYFVERYAKLYRRDGFAIAPAVMERLARHPFPGNVRELENLIKRMIVLDDPFLIRVPLPDPVAGGERLSVSSPPPPEPSLKEIGRRASRAAEREAISKMLDRTGWNRVRAARALRISYRALLYKIKEAGLDAERSAARPSL